MFHHVKELEFNARVTAPDPRFARLLLDQFGGGNGELKAAMQYFLQSFAAKRPFPKHYDLLMDIATEELSHLEIVGATITMLLDGVNGELKDAAEEVNLSRLMKGERMKDDLLQDMVTSPLFLVLTGGGPALTDSEGAPWTGAYVNANGDLTVDLRSNIAAESRAKIVYEYLLQFTDDPLVKETLGFLMTREIAHFQQFAAALEAIQPNFPPGTLAGDPRYTHVYVNTSKDGVENVRGPWNQGQGPWQAGEQWVYIEDPVQHVMQTNGLVDQPIQGTRRTMEEAHQLDRQMSEMRGKLIKEASLKEAKQWSEYQI